MGGNENAQLPPNRLSVSKIWGFKTRFSFPVGAQRSFRGLPGTDEPRSAQVLVKGCRKGYIADMEQYFH